MHWIRPYAFFLLIPLVLVIWRLWRVPKGARGWDAVCDSDLLPFLQLQDPTSQHWPLALLAVIGLLATIALAGPAWHQSAQPVFRNSQPKVVVLDLSEYALVADLKPSRLARAKYKLMDLLQQTHEGQIGLVVFSSEPFVVSPLTTDSHTLQNLVSSLTPSLLPVGGHNVVAALQQAQTLLLGAGVSHGDIILITDHLSDAKEAIKLARTYEAQGFSVSVLGLGTLQGGPVPLPGGGFLKDAAGAMRLAKLEVAPLQQLAQAGGGIYQVITPNNQDIAALVQLLQKNRWSDTYVEQKIQAQLWQDEGWLFVLLLLPLILIGFRRGYFS